MPRIQHKRGTAANLASVNPTPLAGELVWDSTENAVKIGDGATAWSSLAYVTATPRSHNHDDRYYTETEVDGFLAGKSDTGHNHGLSSLSDVSVAGPISDKAFLIYSSSAGAWQASTGIGQVGVGSQPIGGWPAGSVGASLAGKVDTSDARLTDARTPTAHKSSHAAGGSDALAPSDIGAAPAASPAITGNATFEASSGVPVTITNTGSGNSLVVNDAAGDATPFVVDASGRVGIGIQTVALQSGGVGLHIAGGASSAEIKLTNDSTGNAAADGSAIVLSANTLTINQREVAPIVFQTSNAERVRIDSNGNVGIQTPSPASTLHVNGVITVSATSGSAGSYAPSLTFSGDPNTGFGQVSGQSDTASIFTAGHERVRVRSDGILGIGNAGYANTAFALGNSTSSTGASHIGLYSAPAFNSAGTSLFNFYSEPQTAGSAVSLLVGFTAHPHLGGGTVTTAVGFRVSTGFTSGSTNYGFQSSIASGSNRWNAYFDGTAHNYFAGNVGIGSGRTSPASTLDVNGVITVSATSGSAGSYLPSVTFSGDPNTGFGQVSGQSDTASIFTAGSERVRVDASGRVGIGTTSPAGQLELERASNANFSGAFSFEGAALQISDNSDSTTYPTASAQLQFKVGSSGIAEAYIAGVRNSANVSSLVFGTQSGASRSERVRIKSTGAVRFVPLSADPASGEAGDVYYNSTTNKLRVYNGTSWIDLH